MSAVDVLEALDGISGPVQVIGSRALADDVRRLLGDRLQEDAAGAPAAVVDTTGDPVAIVAALTAVETLGTVVLAGPPPDAPVALDLYADLHVRGLVVVGVPPSD